MTTPFDSQHMTHVKEFGKQKVSITFKGVHILVYYQLFYLIYLQINYSTAIVVELRVSDKTLPNTHFSNRIGETEIVN